MQNEILSLDLSVSLLTSHNIKSWGRNHILGGPNGSGASTKRGTEILKSDHILRD
jgi:hypothetical protein